MNMQDAHHVIANENGGWDIKRTNSKRASKHCDTKKEAIEAAKLICQNEGTELIIHDKDEVIKEEVTATPAPKPVETKPSRTRTMVHSQTSPMDVALTVGIVLAIVFYGYLGALYLLG